MNLLITGGLYELFGLQDVPEHELGDQGTGSPFLLKFLFFVVCLF